MVSTAAFHARVRGSFPGHGGLKETKMFLPHPLVKLSIVRSLRDRKVSCSASDLLGLNFEFFVWRAVSSHSSHHPQDEQTTNIRKDVKWTIWNYLKNHTLRSVNTNWTFFLNHVQTMLKYITEQNSPVKQMIGRNTGMSKNPQIITWRYHNDIT